MPCGRVLRRAFLSEDRVTTRMACSLSSKRCQKSIVHASRDGQWRKVRIRGNSVEDGFVIIPVMEKHVSTWLFSGLCEAYVFESSGLLFEKKKDGMFSKMHGPSGNWHSEMRAQGRPHAEEFGRPWVKKNTECKICLLFLLGSYLFAGSL